jgi:hypothetical protein
VQRTLGALSLEELSLQIRTHRPDGRSGRAMEQLALERLCGLPAAREGELERCRHALEQLLRANARVGLGMKKRSRLVEGIRRAHALRSAHTGRPRVPGARALDCWPRPSPVGPSDLRHRRGGTDVRGCRPPCDVLWLLAVLAPSATRLFPNDGAQNGQCPVNCGGVAAVTGLWSRLWRRRPTHHNPPIPSTAPPIHSPAQAPTSPRVPRSPHASHVQGPTAQPPPARTQGW